MAFHGSSAGCVQGQLSICYNPVGLGIDLAPFAGSRSTLIEGFGRVNDLTWRWSRVVKAICRAGGKV